MSTSIAWTDDIGSATLTNILSGTAGRFASWVPMPVRDASRVPMLAGGIAEWKYRTDYCATFKLEYIKRTDLDLVDRLIQQLLSGGQITVNTGDASSHSYTCTLQPDTMPTLEMMSDRRDLEYVLTLSVRSTGTSPMVCEYP